MSDWRSNWRQPRPPIEITPKVEKPKRLTIVFYLEMGTPHALVVLDDCVVARFAGNEARAAAQAYVDELIKHFREGGK